MARPKDPRWWWVLVVPTPIHVIAYVIDVRLGLLVSLPLSFGHVLLEMPLNVSVGRRLFGTRSGGSSIRPVVTPADAR